MVAVTQHVLVLMLYMLGSLLQHQGTGTVHATAVCQSSQPISPAVCFLWLSVHGPLDRVSTSVTAPHMSAVQVDLIMHGVVHGDLVAINRTLQDTCKGMCITELGTALVQAC